MQRIREWMAANPERRESCVPATARLCSSASPGSSNEASRPARRASRSRRLRSIAVDKIHVYGTPFFIEASLPIESAQADHAVSAPDDRAGYRLGDRRTGARRPLFGGRRRRRPHRRPYPPCRPLRDAVAARARHGRGRQRTCRCRCASRHPRSGSRRQRQDEARGRDGKAKPATPRGERQAPRKSRQQAGPPLATGS